MPDALLAAQIQGLGTPYVLARWPIALLLFLVLATTLLTLVALIKHRRWGVLTMIFFAVVVVPITVVIGVRAESFDEPDHVQVAKLGDHRPPVVVLLDKEHGPVVEPIQLADAESAGAAETPPAPDKPPAPEPAPASNLDVDAAASGAEQPSWVTAAHGPDRKVIPIDPRADLSVARDQARDELARWGWEIGGGDPTIDLTREQSAEIAERLRPRVLEHFEEREVAGGTVYVLWWLGEVTPADRARLEGEVSQWERANRRADGVRNVAAGGAGAVALLALVHGLLRGGSSSPAGTGD